jgi:hypothetical protein
MDDSEEVMVEQWKRQKGEEKNTDSTRGHQFSRVAKQRLSLKRKDTDKPHNKRERKDRRNRETVNKRYEIKAEYSEEISERDEIRITKRKGCWNDSVGVNSILTLKGSLSDTLSGLRVQKPSLSALRYFSTYITLVPSWILKATQTTQNDVKQLFTLCLRCAD